MVMRLRSRAKRVPVNQFAMIYGAGNNEIGVCRLRNISDTRTQIELLNEIELPKKFAQSLSRNLKVWRNFAAVWQLSTAVGVRFSSPTLHERL
jgi:hypothetical protein